MMTLFAIFIMPTTLVRISDVRRTKKKTERLFGDDSLRRLIYNDDGIRRLGDERFLLFVDEGGEEWHLFRRAKADEEIVSSLRRLGDQATWCVFFCFFFYPNTPRMRSLTSAWLRFSAINRPRNASLMHH